ncbi:MAG: hypothetical protein QMD77_00030 [Patescibacteria group bacterium]|nr:hypothetical protein [Patescibacteria group bacterium]
MQKEFSFDAESVKKMMKGAAIAVSGAAGLALLNYVGALQFSNPVVAYVVAWAVPTLVNILKEWMAGVPQFEE